MLTIFPSLLSYALVAPFIMRLVVGLFFVRESFRSHTNKKLSCEKIGFLKCSSLLAWLQTAVELIFGVLVLVGLFTQIDAIVIGLFSIAMIFAKMKNVTISNESKTFYFVIFAICLSLLFSGAGFLAFDLPL